MSLTAHAIRRNRVTLVALLALCGAGISAYLAMPQDENPSFVIRVAVVATYFPGASPERVEQLVTDKLEKAILEMPQIHHLSSTSKTSASIIFVEIKEEYADMEPVWKELREKVEVAKRDLPTGVIGPFVNDDFGDVYGIVISLSGDGYSAAELEDVAEELRSELLGASEVAKVEIYGKQPERVYIEYDNASIAALGFSGAALRQLLEMQNIIIPGGSLRAGDEQVVVEPSGNFSTVEDLERTVIRAPDSDALFFLGDVVDIRRGTIEPPEALVHSSAAARPCPPSSAVPGYAPQTCRRALALGVSLREGGNILELGEQVSELVQRFESRAPLGLELEFVAYQPARVVHKVGEFLTNLGQAMLLVIVIMLTALGLRTGMIVAAAVPMTVIVTVFLMSVFGVGIDQVSLAALLIALGMLVDNSIVMSESIMVQMGEGKTPFDAAVGAAAELKWPLLISSLATASAFLPIFLAQSMASEYTQSLFKVVTMCLLSSWALSLTLTPLLCVAFLRVAPRNESVYSRWPFRVYRAILGFFLRQRLLTLVLLGGGIAFSVHLGTQVPQRFFPSDRNLWFLVELELPEGSAVEATEAVVSELEAFMSEELMAQGEGDGIVSWVAFIGNGGPRFILTQNPELASPEYAILLINTATPSVAESMAKIDAFLREKPDLRFKVKEGKLGPPTKNPVSVRISTPDKELLARIGEQVARKLESIHGVRDVNDNWGVKAKKLYVDVHEESARRAGVSNLDVALSLLTAFSGFQMTQLREGDKLIPVVMRSQDAEHTQLGNLRNLNVVPLTGGQGVPLSQLSQVELQFQPSKIIRRNRIRTMEVGAQLYPEVTAADVVAELEPWLREQARGWPTSVHYEFGGDAEESAKSQGAIFEKLPYALIIVVFLLVAMFNSIRRALIVLMVIPLGLIGVFVGLYVTESYIGFMTILGIVSLAGIVCNNGVVLLERIKLEVELNGLTEQQAIIEAAQRRLRPIYLTAGTTVGGLIPLWLGGGPLWEPLAIAIIFGLSFSTVLTLVVIPVVYSLLFGVSFRQQPQAQLASEVSDA